MGFTRRQKIRKQMKAQEIPLSGTNLSFWTSTLSLLKTLTLHFPARQAHCFPRNTHTHTHTLSLSLSLFQNPKPVNLRSNNHGFPRTELGVPHVRGQVPRGGHGGDDPGQEHRRHGRLRLASRVQQHRGHDSLLGALPPSDSKCQQPHQGGPNRARHGPQGRQGERLH